jgi:hypothetical protein
MVPLSALLLLVPSVLAYSVPTRRYNDASTTADVIILGGGISGISVARTLIQDYNITDILLLEARDQLGGRAYTVQLDGQDGETVTVEKGCNWIQGPGREPIKKLADKWGLRTTPTNYDDNIYFEGKVGVLGDAETSPRGSFLSDNETTVFTAGYDNFLDNVSGYACECPLQPSPIGSLQKHTGRTTAWSTSRSGSQRPSWIGSRTHR